MGYVKAKEANGAKNLLDLLLEYIVKPIAIFISGYLFLRLSGKKSISQMNSFDLLFILVVGTIVAEPLVTKNPYKALYYGLFFTLLHLGFAYITLNNKFRWNLIESPTVLLRDGDIDESGLKTVKMTTDELLSEIRVKGFTNPKDLAAVIMENSGQISVIPKSHVRPLQPSDMQIKTSQTFIPIPIIMNGEILDHNLKFLDKDRKWLDKQLSKYHHKNINNISDITLALYNEQGKLDIDTDDQNEKDKKSPYNYKPGNEN